MKVLQITLIKGIDDFCMSKGETIEFCEGGHKPTDVDRPYYPNFGPYILLNLIAEEIVAGTANDEMKATFTAKVKEN
jgi:hypothetical protein